MASSALKIPLTFFVGEGLQVCIFRCITLIIIATSSKLLLTLWFRICVSAFIVYHPLGDHFPLLELLFTFSAPAAGCAVSSAGDLAPWPPVTPWVGDLDFL